MSKPERKYVGQGYEYSQGLNQGFNNGLDVYEPYHNEKMAGKDKVIEELVGELEHIAEYWNRNNNEKAMEDALWHIIEVAEQASKHSRGE